MDRHELDTYLQFRNSQRPATMPYTIYTHTIVPALLPIPSTDTATRLLSVVAAGHTDRRSCDP